MSLERLPPSSPPEKLPDKSISDVDVVAPIEPHGWLKSQLTYWGLAWREFQRSRGYRWMKASSKIIKWSLFTLAGLGLLQIVWWLYPLLPPLVWFTVLLVMVVITQQFGIHFLGRYHERTVRELGVSHKSEIDGLNSRIKELGRELAEETKKYRSEVGQKEGVLKYLNSVEIERGELKAERDSLKSQLERFTKYKLTLEIDAGRSEVQVLTNPEDTLFIMAEINMRFENKDTHPLIIKELHLAFCERGSPNDKRDTREIKTDLLDTPAFFFADGVGQFDEQDFRPIELEGRTLSPDYRYRWNGIVESLGKEKLTTGKHFLRATMKAMDQDPFIADMFVEWEHAFEIRTSVYLVDYPINETH